MDLQAILISVCVVLFTLVLQTCCQIKGDEFKCAVCKIAVDEIEWEVSKVDPKKVLEVKSFRVDPTGRQSYTRKIPYARSETHLTELLENICEKMNQYAESKDATTGKKSYIRTSSRDGSPVNLSNVSLSGEIAEKLKHACEDILGEHEEEVIEVLKIQHENQQQALCNGLLDLCPSRAKNEEL